MSGFRNPGFSSFTCEYQDLVRRIITDDVLIYPAFDPKKYPDKPPYNPLKIRALWDTGATNSVITAKTAKSLNLKPTGTANVQHAGGQAICNTYMLNIVLPNNVGIPGVLATECQSVDFGAIIGMDIITRGDFSVTNVGHKTIVSYRYPSVKKIDYVAEQFRVMCAGVGRNDPCPCGKVSSDGKPVKFKNCCQKKFS